ncbi:radical SAM/SPASM domain-containing protein [Desulfonatronum lacustre]|uniref:radical SAM/SPASM domain-containing protein n=1 Tax=Desulfonatronum lacustre TaxID=66849 RepID=UPI0004B2E074|nr:radical SAM protein [Desulfonatronum lacustre]
MIGLRRFFGGRRTPPVPPALGWVDEFITNVRPFVVVRLEDNLLIRMPNQAHRLNPTGAQVLHFLLSGGKIGELVARIGEQQLDRLRDVALFLHAIRRCLSGDLREDNAGCAVEIAPLETVFSALPVLSEMALTRRCNLRCVFCYAGCAGACGKVNAAGNPQEKGADTLEMSTREVKTILERIRNQAHVPSVSFTGGEPTLRPDLPELIRHASRELSMRVNLISNGTLITPGLANELADAGLASAQISIEGPDGASHDAITQVPGSFVRSCRAVERLRDVGITVHCNTTINRRNLEVVTDMPVFVRDVLHGERFSMNMVIPAGSASQNENPDQQSNPSILVRYTEMASVVLAVQQAAAAAGVEFMWYSPTPLCLFNPILAELGNKGCSACDGLLSVDSFGRILPCSSCEDPMGNLLDEDFQTIWERSGSTTYRNKGLAHPSCRQCDHFPFCHGACPLYWQHFGFAELEDARGFTACPAPRIPLERPVGRTVSS